MSDYLGRQKEKMESLGQLAGGIAHELNNILQPILFAVDSIQRRVPDDEIIQKSSEKITSCTTKAADMIEDILSFSRQDSDRLKFLSVEETMFHAIEFSKGLLPSTVKVSVSDKLGSDYWAWINDVDMVRVFTNLLINASDAMEKKGEIQVALSYVTVSQSTKETDYAVVGEALPSGRYACLSVKDHGQGCSPEELKNIFNPFFTTKDIGEGTGIGLPIVYNIVKNWKGGIQVTSRLGQGAEFLLYIPVYRTDEGAY